jgi:hypothetical protein
MDRLLSELATNVKMSRCLCSSTNPSRIPSNLQPPPTALFALVQLVGLGEPNKLYSHVIHTGGLCCRWMLLGMKERMEDVFRLGGPIEGGFLRFSLR